jgi:hypothetical protein
MFLVQGHPPCDPQGRPTGQVSVRGARPGGRIQRPRPRTVGRIVRAVRRARPPPAPAGRRAEGATRTGWTGRSLTAAAAVSSAPPCSGSSPRAAGVCWWSGHPRRRAAVCLVFIVVAVILALVALGGAGLVAWPGAPEALTNRTTVIHSLDRSAAKYTAFSELQGSTAALPAPERPAEIPCPARRDRRAGRRDHAPGPGRRYIRPRSRVRARHRAAARTARWRLRVPKRPSFFLVGSLTRQDQDHVMAIQVGAVCPVAAETQRPRT